MQHRLTSHVAHEHISSGVAHIVNHHADAHDAVHSLVAKQREVHVANLARPVTATSDQFLQ